VHEGVNKRKLKPGFSITKSGLNVMIKNKTITILMEETVDVY